MICCHQLEDVKGVCMRLRYLKVEVGAVLLRHARKQSFLIECPRFRLRAISNRDYLPGIGNQH